MDLKERIQDTLPDILSSDKEVVELVEALADKHALDFAKWHYSKCMDSRAPTKESLATFKIRHPHGY